MRIEQLHYFDTLIQEGSFTKAAAQLHIAQPSLTASIKAMEKELDTKLVFRNLNGISLTPEGEKVLHFAQAVLKLHNNLIEELKPSSMTNERLTVFASNFFYKIILEQFLPQFTQSTQIPVRSMDSDFTTSLEWFYAHNCNFAIVSQLNTEDASKCVPDMIIPDDKFFHNDLTYIPIFQTEFGVCMSAHSSLQYVEELTPLYIKASNQPTTLFPSRYIKLSDQVLFTTSTIDSHVEAISRNRATSSLPYFAYQHYFSTYDDIVFRPFSNGLFLTYFLVYPKGHILTAAEQIFIAQLAKYLSPKKQYK